MDRSEKNLSREKFLKTINKEKKLAIIKRLFLLNIFTGLYLVTFLMFVLTFYPEKINFKSFLFENVQSENVPVDVAQPKIESVQSENAKPEDVQFKDYQTFIGIILAAMTFGYKIYRDRKKEKKEHRNWLLRNKKAILIEIVDLLISGLGKTAKISTRELDERLRNINSALIAYGSKEILDAFAAFRMSKGDKDINKILKSAERLLRIIRAEFGFDDSQMRPGEVLSVLVPREKGFAFEICKDENYDDIRPNRGASQDPPSSDGFHF